MFDELVFSKEIVVDLLNFVPGLFDSLDPIIKLKFYLIFIFNLVVKAVVIAVHDLSNQEVE